MTKKEVITLLVREGLIVRKTADYENSYQGPCSWYETTPAGDAARVNLIRSGAGCDLSPGDVVPLVAIYKGTTPLWVEED
ncbi:hypothetical protein M0R36_10950 [bacterium]|jgi:hypothetical protein|nr:hypothetical protein [bacterium]